MGCKNYSPSVFICNNTRDYWVVYRWNFWNIHSNKKKSALGDVENVSAFGQIWVEYNLDGGSERSLTTVI